MRRKNKIFRSVAVALLLFILLPLGLTISSTSGEFTVVPENVYINWTNASEMGSYITNITINNTKDYNITIEIANFTENAILVPEFVLDTENKGNCYFQGEGSSANNKFTCMNISAIPNNTFLIENNTAVNISLLPKNITFLFAYPGRYIATLVIRNQTNTSENTTINISLDVPINFTYFGSRVVKLGEFLTAGATMKYEIKANNKGKQDAHFYYFNASELNASAIFVNISDSSLEMFLFNKNENTLLANSYNTSSGKHELLYSPQNIPSDYLKLYIYGNSSSNITYQAFISLFTIHALNASDETRKFGFNQEPFLINLSAGENNYTAEFILENKGKYNYSNVVETKENYLVYNFSGIGNKSFDFLVPENAQEIKVELEFNNSGNYSLTLRNTSDIVLTKYYNTITYYEIITGKRKITLNYQNPSPGKWSIEITNISGNSDYTASVYISLPENLIQTNYSTKDFKELGMENSSYPVNFTYNTEAQTIPGDYLVELSYKESSGAGLKIPLKFRVLGASALINGKFKQDSISLVENLKINLTLNLSFVVENYGNQNITNISLEIANLTNGNSYVNITRVFVNDSLYSKPFTLPNNSFVNIKAEINIDETKANKEGIYSGYVLLNMSNSEFKVTPYDYINFSINLNLTKWLITNSTSLSPNQVNVTTSPENVTLSFKVYYANGTLFGSGVELENISKIILIHKNVTSKTFDVTSTKTYDKNTVTTIWYGNPDNIYKLNFTVPEGIYGGYYDVFFNFTAKDTAVLKGEAKTLLAVEGDALAVNIFSAPSSMQNGTEDWLNISITNYGLNKSINAELEIQSSLISSITSIPESNCTNSYSTKTLTFTLDAQKACKISMKIKASSSSGSGTVYLNGKEGLWIKNASFSLTVNAPTSSSSSSQQGSQGGESTTQTSQNQTTPVFVKDLAFMQYPSSIKIEQGKSEAISVSVKNTGNLTLYNLTLTISGIDKSWFKVSQKTDLSPEKTHTFTVNITVPENAKIEKKSIKFIASSGDFNKSVSSTLEITPSEKYKQEVEQNLTSLKEIYKNLTEIYLSYKEKGIENETISNKLSDIEKLISQTENFIKSNDYVSASSLLSSISNMIEETKTMIKALEIQEKEKAKNQFILIIAIISIAIGGGLLVYLLLPPPHGYEPEKGFRYVPKHHRGKPRLKRIVEELKKIKEKIKKEKREEAIFE